MKFLSVVQCINLVRITEGTNSFSVDQSVNVVGGSNQHLLSFCVQSAYFLSVTVGGTYNYQLALGVKHRGTLPLPVTFTTR